jgi:hypothetical protein
VTHGEAKVRPTLERLFMSISATSGSNPPLFTADEVFGPEEPVIEPEDPGLMTEEEVFGPAGGGAAPSEVIEGGEEFFISGNLPPPQNSFNLTFNTVTVGPVQEGGEFGEVTLPPRGHDV